MYSRASPLAEAMSVLGKSKAMWQALMVANPIAVTDQLENACLRQRNACFGGSDTAFQTASRRPPNGDGSRPAACPSTADAGSIRRPGNLRVPADPTRSACADRSASVSPSRACRDRSAG